MPQAFYTDPDLYDFDVSAIITHSWLMIGFEVELLGGNRELEDQRLQQMALLK